MSAKDNPLVRALAEVAFELVQDEVKHQCDRLEEKPLGHLIKEIKRRKQQIDEEGREPTQRDIEEFFAAVPGIVAGARARQRDK